MSNLVDNSTMSGMEYVNRVTAERDRSPDLARNLTIRFTSSNTLSTLTWVLLVLVVLKYLIGDFIVLKHKIIDFILRGRQVGYTNMFSSSTSLGAPGMPQGSNKVGIFIIVAILVIIICLLIILGMYLSRKADYDDKEVVMIHKGFLDFENTTQAAAAKITRSENKPGGSEFSYGMFVRINDIKPSARGAIEPLIIMQKGTGNLRLDDTSKTRNCPSITYQNGAMTFYIDTIAQANIVQEKFILNNIPLKRDFHLILAVRDRNADVFIDGTLAMRHKLKGNVAYNDDAAVFVKMGSTKYLGHLGNIMYFSHYLTQNEIESISDPYITIDLIDIIPCDQ
jgi:hypothetical protein